MTHRAVIFNKHVVVFTGAMQLKNFRAHRVYMPDKEPMLFTTAAQRLNQETLPKASHYCFRAAFSIFFGGAKEKQ